ncbi:MAG: (Fe-S)-binding protein [Deltaproteobacteria bacterium]|nr:(Fe-S)-binding protein [Deltaproteobacteria bacterium]
MPRIPLTQKASWRKAVYFPGCRQLDRRPDLILDAFKLLDFLRVDNVVPYSEPEICCGLPLYQAGLKEEFQRHAKLMVSRLSKYKRIICPCPACAHTFKVLYRKIAPGLTRKIMHLTEIIWPKLARREAAPVQNQRIAYHDPCYLGRHLGIYDIPRRILSHVGYQVTEFIWAREQAGCCGGGGSVDLNFPELADLVAGRRIEEALLIDFDYLATACPGCLTRLVDAGKDSGLKVKDITELVMKALFNLPESSPEGIL